jgi:hypothetical protein
LTATAGSQYNQSCSAGNPPPPPSACQNPNNGVPYASSTYPGGPAKSHVDSCSPSFAASHQNNPCPAGDAASRADSDASQLNSDAAGYYAGGGTQPFSGATGESHTYVTAGGTLTVTTHSEVHNFVLGNVHVSKVVVDTIVTSTLSSATADAHVVVGKVTVNGQPVNVTDQGMTVQQTKPIPCPGTPPVPVAGPSPAPSPQPVPSPPGILPPLPPPSLSAYSSCVPGVDVTYVKLFTAKPTKTVSGSHGTASATGLHILVTHPAPGPGVPQQSTEYVLGEGYADGNAGAGAGGGAFPGAGFFPGDGFGGFGGFGGFDAGGTGAAGLTGGASALGNAIFVNRIPLALLFFTLEALVFGAAAAWVWARNAPREQILDEVLAP